MVELAPWLLTTVPIVRDLFQDALLLTDRY